MSRMTPCKDPRICGVQNHRPGTVCRADISSMRKRGAGAPTISNAPPSASGTRDRSRPDGRGNTLSDYGTMEKFTPGAGGHPPSYKVDDDAFSDLPRGLGAASSSAHSIRGGEDFRTGREDGFASSRGLHAIHTGDKDDAYVVMNGTTPVGFRDSRGNFVVYGENADSPSRNMSREEAIIHAAARLDVDAPKMGTLIPEDQEPAFKVRVVGDRSEFHRQLDERLSGG